MPTGATARPEDDFGPRQSTARISLAEPGERVPFAWQDGRRLWILDGSAAGWVLAELLFDPRSCRYFEIRRASYRWPREAAGALLGRTLAGGQARAEAASRELSKWITRVNRPR